jgi:hypothetical protein
MTPKILIMVLSCGAHPFDRLMRAQQRTWDSIDWPDVRTVFYIGGACMDRWDGNILRLRIDDGYDWMLEKFALALRILWDLEWDYVFRTNASSYVCKRKLADVASLLPRTKVYGGVIGKTSIGRTHVGGSGMFLSRDVIDLLMDNIKPRHQTSCVEDGEIGHILGDLGVPCMEIPRCEYYSCKGTLPDVHHYKCRPPIPPEQLHPDRDDDIKAMEKIHALKHENSPLPMQPWGFRPVG